MEPAHRLSDAAVMVQQGESYARRSLIYFLNCCGLFMLTKGTLGVILVGSPVCFLDI